MDTLYVVVPCYNEEDVLPETSKRLKKKLLTLIKAEKISQRSKILFVNDGSIDKTWEMISNLHAKDRSFSGVNLSRNRGRSKCIGGWSGCSGKLCGYYNFNGCRFAGSAGADTEIY